MARDTLSLDPPLDARRVYEDPVFLACAGMGLTFWAVLAPFLSAHPRDMNQILSWSLLSVTVWQPILEEILFRDVLQTTLLRTSWGARRLSFVSVANVTTSCAFSAAHLGSHAPAWAALVFFPSLLFGTLRDRFDSIAPSVLLHVFYNGGYFLLVGIPMPTSS